MTLSRRMMAVVSIVVIAASVLVIALRQCNRSAMVNLDPFAAAGEVMADETRALLGGRGRVVVVTCDTAKVAMFDTPQTLLKITPREDRQQAAQPPRAAKNGRHQARPAKRQEILP